MTIRDRLILFGANVLAAILAAVLARWGIQLPPVPPPSAVLPPDSSTPPRPAPKPDPLNAIVRLSRPGVGCSGTTIGDKRPDGRYLILSAHHCTARIGERWTAKFRDGRTVGLQVVSRGERPDYAWMLTDVTTEVFPFALLADADPPLGTKVFHAGYGVDNPGNREEGTVTRERNADGQLGFRISVSSGDSGGGIVLDAEGKVVSPVCCTTAPGRLADVWGSSPVVARQGLVIPANLDLWEPIPIPVRPPSNMPAEVKNAP